MSRPEKNAAPVNGTSVARGDAMRLSTFMLSSVLILSGCATENAPLRHEPATDGKRHQTNIGVPRTYKYAESEATDPRFFLTAYEGAGTNKHEVRNRIIVELMGLIDDNYGEFERALSATARGKNFGVSTASIALTGVASFASGGTANVLAAIDTALKGISSSVDKDLLAGKATEALVYQMRANRSKRQQSIYESMKESVIDYPLEFGLRDLINYFNEGSVTFALVSLTQTVGGEAASAASSAAKARPTAANAGRSSITAP
jgi:hypothetical protein